jgi:TPR repeat protein
MKLREEAKKREDERRFLSEAASRCDALAANPHDPRRVGEGVAYDSLKPYAEEAIKNCEVAAAQAPAELRFKYQLARALEQTNRPKAMPLLQDLVARGYPAAFDNLGWIYLTDKKDIRQAVNLFERGVRAGDPDSMVSLAEMINRGYADVANPAQAKMELYSRASQLGNDDAARAYQSELAKAQAAQQENIQRLEQQRLFMQFMGAAFQAIPRR